MADKIIKFLAYNGKISVTCADTTELVEMAKEIHDLSPVVTAAFGRLITITTIIGSEMKGKEDKLTIQLKGSGKIGKMITVCNNKPEVKGYVTNPYVDIPLNEDGKLDVGKAVGNNGFINVIKDIGLKEPYIGIAPLTSGEIAEDFAHYFEISEQKQTAVALGVLINKDGVKSSGGYIIRPMPDATEEEIIKIEQSIFKAGSVSKMLDSGLSLVDIAKKITGDTDIQIIEENIVPKYVCDCNKEHMARGLSTIGKEELREIIDVDGKAELTCHFCNKKYEFSKEELENLYSNMK